MPSSPSARAYEFGKLGLSLVTNTVAEAVKQNLGLSEETSS